MTSQATARLLGDDANYRPRHACADEPAERPPLVAVADPTDDRAGRHLADLLPDQDLAANGAGTPSGATPVRKLGRFARTKSDETSSDPHVVRKLAKLDKRWRVLNSIPVGHNGTDVHHLVIGPAGVFLVNTEQLDDAAAYIAGDTVTVDGQYQPYVRNGRFSARRAGRLLAAVIGTDVIARSVVTLSGNSKGGIMIKEQPRDGSVVLLAANELTGYLKGLPADLDDDAVQSIYAAARHLATWQPSTVRWSEF